MDYGFDRILNEYGDLNTRHLLLWMPITCFKLLKGL